MNQVSRGRRASRRPLLVACISLPAFLAAALGACSSNEPTPTEGAPTPAAPNAARLVPSAIDDSQRVVLTGNTHPSATPAHVTGRMPRDTYIEYMQLVLQRSPEQEAELEARIDALHDNTSPEYHQWIGLEEFASKYGVAQADVDVIVGWLRGHGFRVDHVAPSRMFIEFSGSIGAIEDAFHTPMGALEVKGVKHMANLRDPEIPVELAKAVVGVHALHDFMPHPMHKKRGAVQRNHVSGAWRVTRPSPDFTFSASGCTSNADCDPTGRTGQTCNANGACSCTSASQCTATPSGGAAACTNGGCVVCRSNADCSGPGTCNTATNVCEETFHAIAPADFATIYNLNPLFAAGLTGAGQKVVVIEDTQIANASDVATFRSAFGLPVGTFSQVTPPTSGGATCTNSGVTGDEGEAALDAEWAGATAPDAAIELASCANTRTTFGGLNALQDLVNGNSPPPIVSISYGQCEASNGTANASFVSIYQQAAAAGVSVFVSSGDEGAASCDANEAVATHGIAVSGFASTPYNVAVGGTDFMDYYNSQNGGPAVSTYWNATNTATFGSALSYVPEVPWDDSCASPLLFSTPSIALGNYTQAYGAAGFCNSTTVRTSARPGPGAAARATTRPAVLADGRRGPAHQVGRQADAPGHLALRGERGVRPLPGLLPHRHGGGRRLLHLHQRRGHPGARRGRHVVRVSGNGRHPGHRQSEDERGPGKPQLHLLQARGGRVWPARHERCNGSASRLPFERVHLQRRDGRHHRRQLHRHELLRRVRRDQGALSTSTTALAPAYNAATGWDFATGLGTVNAYNLVQAWSQ